MPFIYINFIELFALHSPVADSDAMGVAPQVVDHLFGTAKGAFGIHHPLVFIQRGEQLFERFFRRQALGLSVELQVPLLVQVSQVVQEFTSEQTG